MVFGAWQYALCLENTEEQTLTGLWRSQHSHIGPGPWSSGGAGGWHKHGHALHCLLIIAVIAASTPFGFRAPRAALSLGSTGGRIGMHATQGRVHTPLRRVRGVKFENPLVDMFGDQSDEFTRD